MKKLLFFFLLLLGSVHTAFAQPCNCGASFDWMVNTFKTNDAGFSYVIEKKGADEYKKHTDFYREKAFKVNSINECLPIMRNWLFFFRRGHIGIDPKGGYNQNFQAGTPSEQSKDSIRNLYKNEETIDFTEERFKEFLQKRVGKLNAIEGIWKSNNYRIGITRSSENSKQFVGFIIKADSIYWLPKQKKLELTLNDDSTFSMIYSMRDHSKKNESARIVGESGNLLMMINSLWLKVYPESILTMEDQLYINLRNAVAPFMESLSKKTLYLRIPSFQYEQKPSIDSLLQRYDSMIRTTPNLVIDIRNGTGGSDLSFFHLMPYIYTQPVRDMNMKYYSTELNAQGYDDWAASIKDTAIANQCHRIAVKMRQNIGSFITTDESKVSMDSSYKASEFPVRIAIICNQYNGSTDESFLLKAKQSLKVKVFGRPTMGALDFSNIHVVESPDGLFNMVYCMTASFRIPDFPIDGVGIQPDFFIDETVPEEEWIHFVQSVIER